MLHLFRYTPTRPEILIAPARGVSSILSRQLGLALKKFNSRDNRQLKSLEQQEYEINEKQKLQAILLQEKSQQDSNVIYRDGSRSSKGSSSGSISGRSRNKKESTRNAFSESSSSTDNLRKRRKKEIPRSSISSSSTAARSINENNDNILNAISSRAIKLSSPSPALSSTTPIVLSHIRDLYPKFQYSDLASHPAIVILPYQVSSCYHFVYLCLFLVHYFCALFEFFVLTVYALGFLCSDFFPVDFLHLFIFC